MKICSLYKNVVIIFYLFAVSLIISGCSALGGTAGTTAEESDGGKPNMIVENAPYYPTEFKDLLIPGELKLNSEKTLSIRTASFAGGILNFTGRVEMNSLADFFSSTMQKNGWKLTGTVKHKEILLAFVKPYKTCMLRIVRSDFGMSTEVFAYITEEIKSPGAL